MKDNPFIKSLQKGLNEDDIASNIHHYLNDCIIKGECYNVDNGKFTSCRCIANVDRNMEVWHKLYADMIEFNNYNTTNMKLYLQGIILHGYLIKQRKPRRDKWKPEFYVNGVSDEKQRTILLLSEWVMSLVLFRLSETENNISWYPNPNNQGARKCRKLK